jgi:hypothetical protein
MIIALRNKEMKLVMMNESKVCHTVSAVPIFADVVAYASPCHSRISLHGVGNDRAVGRSVRHRRCDSLFKISKDYAVAVWTREVKECCSRRRIENLERVNVSERERKERTASL